MTLILAALFALALTVLIEAVYRRGFSSVFRWAIKEPLKFLSNLLFVLAVLLALAFLTGSLFAGSAIVFLLTFLLVTFSSFKHAARNEPLYFADLLLAFKVAGIAGPSNIVITPILIIGVLGGMLALGLLFLMGPMSLEGWEWVVAAAVFILGIIVPKKNDLTYLSSGFLNGLMANAMIYFKQPTIDKQALTPAVMKPSLKPVNIIAVLSESFFDITRLKNLELSRDPLPFFRKVQERGVRGTLLVTPFGGGTCAVEAEFLTGAVMRHINSARPFYYGMAKKPVPALPSFLKGAGYQTAALHAYSKSFYNRDQAFRNMGFDSFIGAEDMTGARKDGPYISDEALCQDITSLFAKKTGSAFIFGISMENHQPYTADKYAKTSVKVLNSNLGPRLRAETETYLHGLSHADQMLERLVEMVDTCPEPTCLLFFGDHLAALGRELDLYRKMCYINASDLSMDDITRIYSPDFLILSNFTQEKARHDLVGANFLPYLLLEYAGLDRPGIFGALEGAFDQLRCVSRDDVFVDSRGRYYRELPKELREAEEKLLMETRKALRIL